MSLEVGFDLTAPSSEFREAYHQLYRRKRRELAFSPRVPGLDAGLNRYYQITRFHEESTQRQPPMTSELLRANPYAAVAVDAYRVDPSIRRNPDHAIGVMELMADYPWYEVYGLSYKDTMKLTVHEYSRLRDVLLRRYPPKARSVREPDPT